MKWTLVSVIVKSSHFGDKYHAPYTLLYFRPPCTHIRPRCACNPFSFSAADVPPLFYLSTSPPHPSSCFVYFCCICLLLLLLFPSFSCFSLLFWFIFTCISFFVTFYVWMGASCSPRPCSRPSGDSMAWRRPFLPARPRDPAGLTRWTTTETRRCCWPCSSTASSAPM